MQVTSKAADVDGRGKAKLGTCSNAGPYMSGNALGWMEHDLPLFATECRRQGGACRRPVSRDNRLGDRCRIRVLSCRPTASSTNGAGRCERAYLYIRRSLAERRLKRPTDKQFIERGCAARARAAQFRIVSESPRDEAVSR
jgi:hypothetical protein